MREKIELVARAIATACWRRNLDEFADKEKWDEAADAYDLTNNNGRFDFDQEAIAAIDAMRSEPVAYAYVVDGECEEIGWGAPPIDDPSTVLLFALSKANGEDKP